MFWHHLLTRCLISDSLYLFSLRHCNSSYSRHFCIFCQRTNKCSQKWWVVLLIRSRFYPDMFQSTVAILRGSWVAYKALMIPWGWQPYAETCRGRIWNVLIKKNPLLSWAFVGLFTNNTTRSSVQPSRSLYVV
jgi:hypothetical protein